MNFESFLVFGIIVLYFIGTLGMFIGTLSMRRKLKDAANWCAISGFALHSVALVLGFASSSLEELSAAYFMQVFAWCVVFLYLIAWKFLRLNFLSLIAIPFALVLCIFSVHLSSVTNVLPENLSTLFMGVHILSLFTSLGLMAFGFGAALLFLYMERRIKHKMPLAEFAKDFPALSTCDKINAFAVTFGFPLYTLGLMSSVIWMPLSQASIGTPKVLVSLLVWILFALLFYQRLALGHKGRRTAVMLVLIFSVALFSFIIDISFTHHSQLLQP